MKAGYCSGKNFLNGKETSGCLLWWARRRCYTVIFKHRLWMPIKKQSEDTLALKPFQKINTEKP